MIRLDVHFRVGPSTDSLTLNYNGGGDSTLTLTSGVYASLAALCAEIETQTQTVDASMTCTESSGVVTIAGGATFTIDWDCLSLMEWLGYSVDLGGSDSYTAPATCRGTFVSSLPWSDRPTARLWEWHLKQWRGDKQTGSARKLGKVTLWRTEALVLREELAGFRSVMSHLLSGYPARWWRDTGTATAWSYTNWWGYVDVVLSPGQTGYADLFVERDFAGHLRVPLELVEV